MYFITVSEMMGTNGEKIARQVAQGLGYTFYGEEELGQILNPTRMLAPAEFKSKVRRRG